MKKKKRLTQKLKEKITEKMTYLREIIADDNKRRQIMFKSFNVLLCIVSSFMTVVNILSQKWLLMAFTLTFSIACIINIVFSCFGKTFKKIANALFLVESLVLCSLFCISGTPEGFSALWICFIPTFSLALIGTKLGSIYSVAGFLVIIFLFWTPWGRSCLQYEYTQSFMLRFPMIYTAFFIVSLFLEFVRAETQRKLRESEKRYQFLYKHDSLTEIYNRYGFNEKLDEIYSSNKNKTVTLMILDLDEFKRINDVYGHSAGDVILRTVAHKICFLGGENAVVSRWGGEEFTLLCTNVEKPETLAENIRRYIAENTITVGKDDISVTVSIGVCTVSSRKNISIATFVQVADKCLYCAKDAGRNAVKSASISDSNPPDNLVIA